MFTTPQNADVNVGAKISKDYSVPTYTWYMLFIHWNFLKQIVFNLSIDVDLHTITRL